MRSGAKIYCAWNMLVVLTVNNSLRATFYGFPKECLFQEMSEQVSRASSSCEPTAPDSSPPSLSAKVQELIDLSRIMSTLSAGGNGAYVGAPVGSESASSAAQVSG